jgi:hypothetical protein
LRKVNFMRMIAVGIAARRTHTTMLTTPGVTAIVAHLSGVVRL